MSISSGRTSSAPLSSSSTLSVNTTLEPPAKSLPTVPDSGSLSAMPMLQAVNAAALMERTPFAIDDAKDDEDDDDDEFLDGKDNDDQVLDEVIHSLFLLMVQCSMLTWPV
jgi:hypothetical protein